MGRTLVAYTPAAAAIALMWLRLESPPRDELLALWLAALALLPALARRPWTRALGYAGAAALAVGSTLAVSPFELGRAAARFGEGVALFYDEQVPVAAREQPDMAAVLLLATFAFCALLALAVAARRPVAATAVVLVGAGWPATLLQGGGDLVRGGVILASALVLLAALRRTPMRHALVAGVVVLVAAVGASTSGAVDRGAFLAWEKWDAYDAAPRPVGVAYVWNGRYAGVTFPKRETTVLKVEAGPQRTYWRATTLDVYDEAADRWIERRPVKVASLTEDPLLPAAARNPDNWRRQLVTVEALRDYHLVGGSIPVAFEGVGALGVRYGWGGVAYLEEGRRLERDQRYTVWSYEAQPQPKKLASLPAKYPLDDLRRGRYLRVGLPPFGARGRHADVLEAFDTFLSDEYRPLYLTAREVVGSPKTPYGAVVALESWFRRTGGFVYDEQPGVRPNTPPLVDFVERKRGYCQHFAGAMALMLRYLGIPSRVAAGFTSGEYDERTQTWTVTDHDAHTWVEAWFPEFGWLPFDPTPARGQLSGGYTASSDTFSASSPDVLNALGRGVGADLLRREGLEGLRGNTPFGSSEPSGGGRSLADGGRAVLPSLVTLAAFALALLVVVKDVRRRARYLRRDSRSLARAARGEIVGFLADQGVEVPASATAAELAALVEQRYGVRAEGFARSLAAARYAPSGEREARRARREARDVLRRLRARLSVRARVRGLLSLRSLTT